MQVRGVAEDLQLAAHARVRGVGEVEREERIGLPEGDHVAAVLDEAHGVDALAAAEAADLPDLLEPARAGREHRDVALAVAAERRRGGRPQHAGVLGQRELVEQLAGHLAAGAVVRALRPGDVEAVDRRVVAIPPAGGRHVDAPRRGVDGARVRHHGVGIHGGQALIEVDGEHREHPRAGEPRRPAHVVARDERPLALAAGAAVAQHGRRDPARAARAQWAAPRRVGDDRRARDRDGPGTGPRTARGTEETTIRAVAPCRRELTWSPSTLSVFSTRIAAGLPTSTSVSRVPAPPEEITSARRPCSSSSPP